MKDFIPQFRSKIPKKLMEEKWIRSDEPQVILFQGMRGSGKGVAVDKTAEDLYKEGVNIWHIWAARSFENLYWVINKNCNEKYGKIKLILESFTKDCTMREWARKNNISDEEFDYYLEIMKQQKIISTISNNINKIEETGYQILDDELLHCKCNKAYPIVWIVPDYIEVDQQSLDKFNKQCWESLDEYKNYSIEITSEEKRLLFEKKLKKPKELCPKPLIIVKYITPPTNVSRKEIFQNQFTEIVIQARQEKRVVVMNPAIFEFATDKFDTLSEIIRMIPHLMNKSGHFSPLTESDVGKSRKYWTKQQKSWHKVAIVINELRSVAPSSRLSGERESSKSKKAIFDFIPEARHMKTWFLGDYQNPDDLYAGVRYQANVVVIKRASKNILGNDWAWLFDKIDHDRMGFVRKYLRKDIEKPEEVRQYEKIYGFKEFLEERRPRISELPDNVGYVTSINGEVIRWRFDMPSFHHKTSLEDFKLDTGINWKINVKKKSKIKDTDDGREGKEVKTMRDEILKKIHHMHTFEQKSFKIIKDELVQMQLDGIIPDIGYEDREPIYFNNLWNRWKKRNGVEDTTNA